MCAGGGERISEKEGGGKEAGERGGGNERTGKRTSALRGREEEPTLHNTTQKNECDSIC